MKIACAGFFEGFGGAERSLISLANELSERGHEVQIISIGNENIKYNVNANIKIKNIKDNGSKIKKIISRYLDFRQYINENKFDVVINFWMELAIFSNGLNAKNIYSERGDPKDKEYWGIKGIIRKIGFKQVDGFVFQSNAAKKCFSKKVQRKSIVIHNAVDICNNKEIKFEDRKKTITTVGRLHPQKNQKILIKAFKKVVKKHPEYNLKIYGTGESEKKLKKLCKSLKIDKKVEFLGNTKDVAKEIVDTHIFVLSSNYEGMPNVLLEAMALGIPCISTNYKPNDAVKDIIENEKNGIICRRNSVNDLYKSIIVLIKNDKLAAEISLNAKKVKDNHIPKKIYDLWEKKIFNVVGENNDKR